MEYPDRIVVQRHGGVAQGTRDIVTGAHTPPAEGPVVLYDGPADVQHRTRSRLRGDDGQVTLRSDADIYFPAGAVNLWRFQTDDWVLIGRDVGADVERVGRLVTVDHLSEMATVIYVAQTLKRVVTEDLGFVLTTEDGAPLKW